MLYSSKAPSTLTLLPSTACGGLNPPCTHTGPALTLPMQPCLMLCRPTCSHKLHPCSSQTPPACIMENMALLAANGFWRHPLPHACCQCVAHHDMRSYTTPGCCYGGHRHSHIRRHGRTDTKVVCTNHSQKQTLNTMLFVRRNAALALAGATCTGACNLHCNAAKWHRQ